MDIEIKWNLCRSDIIYDERNLFVWRENLNSELSVVCGCQEKPYIPDFIEIHRNGIVGDILLSGNLQLFTEDENNCLVDKLFFQLLEDNYSLTRMDLKYSHNFTESARSFLIIGNISVREYNEKLKIGLFCDSDSEENECISETDDFLDSWYSRFSSYTDVYLRCGSVSIPVHKKELSKCSPVFASMFENITEDTIDIDYIDAPTLQAMLTYVYTGKIDNFTDALASDLLFAAHNYQLGQLKEVCSNHLKRNLNINNVIGIISIGDLIDPGLKDYGLKFLSSKCKISEMELTKDWKILEKNRQEFALEILTTIEDLRKKDLQEMRKKLSLI
ncbi:speckle-type POZ protein-like B [Trichonephila clavata]|uniref:Speckle-type POZ protein-like B n=1 Tax=Trichonephila clavata TaxID=2740835 RepID=A0A8X6KX44_TRICU|nr:speckle-type POZ protein-like B [Trichonephila clavata]